MSRNEKILVNISMEDIVKLAGGPEKACFVKGQSLYNSRMVHDAVVESNDGSKYRITGAVTQFSYPKNPPHEVLINFGENTNGENTIQASCKCLAGNTGTCKHVFAILLKIHQEKFVRQATCTEIPQRWDNVPKLDFDPKKMSEFCDPPKKPYQKLSVVQLSEEERDKSLDIFLSGFPNSSLAKHKLTRKTCFENKRLHDLFLKPQEIPDHLFDCDYTTRLDKEFTSAYLIFYDKFIGLSKAKSKELFVNRNRTESPYFSVRIEDFRCHELSSMRFNMRTNWKKKIEYFFGAGRHGNDFQDRIFKQKILQGREGLKFCRTFVNPYCPFISCNLDGYIPDQHRVVKVVFPKEGSYLSSFDLIGKLSSPAEDKDSIQSCWLHEHNGEVMLKPNSEIYAELQVQMFLTNSSSSDLLIFDRLDNDFFTVETPVNKQFAKKLIESVESKYFDYLFPQIFLKYDKRDDSTFQVEEENLNDEMDLDQKKTVSNKQEIIVDSEIHSDDDDVTRKIKITYQKCEKEKAENSKRLEYLKKIDIVSLNDYNEEKIQKIMCSFIESDIFRELNAHNLVLFQYSALDYTTAEIFNEQQIFFILKLLESSCNLDFGYISENVLPEFIIFAVGLFLNVSRQESMQQIQDQNEKVFMESLSC